MKFLNIKITPNNRYDCISPLSSLSCFSSRRYTKSINRYDNRIPYPIKIVNITLKLDKLKVNRNVR